MLELFDAANAAPDAPFASRDAPPPIVYNRTYIYPDAVTAVAVTATAQVCLPVFYAGVPACLLTPPCAMGPLRLRERRASRRNCYCSGAPRAPSTACTRSSSTRAAPLTRPSTLSRVSRRTTPFSPSSRSRCAQ